MTGPSLLIADAFMRALLVTFLFGLAVRVAKAVSDLLAVLPA